MADTTENLYSIDPEVLIPLIHKGEVNGYPVLDYGTDGRYVYVLCFTGNFQAEPYVTWSIWRTEAGKIAATMGHYHGHVSDAVIELRARSDREAGLDDLVRDIEREREALRR